MARASDERAHDRRTGSRLGLLIVILVVFGGAGSFLVARRHWWLPPLASAQGEEIDRLIYTTLAVTGLAFVLVQALLAVLVWRYAARGTERAAYIPEHRQLELTYTLVPAAVLVTLIAMGGVLWDRIQGPAPANAMVVDVRAEQFTWLFRYPGADGGFGRVGAELISRDNPMGLDPADAASHDDVVARELYLVINRPARLRIRSKDVIHSFFIPSFRMKQDAVPGMVTEMWVTPTKEGNYEAACAELCGVGHYIMKGQVRVVSQQVFDAWLAQQQEQ